MTSPAPGAADPVYVDVLGLVIVVTPAVEDGQVEYVTVVTAVSDGLTTTELVLICAFAPAAARRAAIGRDFLMRGIASVDFFQYEKNTTREEGLKGCKRAFARACSSLPPIGMIRILEEENEGL